MTKPKTKLHLARDDTHSLCGNRPGGKYRCKVCHSTQFHYGPKASPELRAIIADRNKPAPLDHEYEREEYGAPEWLTTELGQVTCPSCLHQIWLHSPASLTKNPVRWLGGHTRKQEPRPLLPYVAVIVPQRMCHPDLATQNHAPHLAFVDHGSHVEPYQCPGGKKP